ncbi:MAG: phospho-sugar mutase [Ruminococcaceae bacterium]|nr:phospho-sugar mutase [Oscillospiraceae bacterium]
MTYIERYKKWIDSDKVDAKTKEELLSIKDNHEEIKERFIKDLEFGTAGLRGIIGAGDNRMNIYTVRKATQGLSEDIKSQGEEAMKKGVVIAYDSRHKSDEFALETALVLAANGIKVYLFDELRPVPELSFAVRYLKCTRGVVITASHNPKEYNGYKAYGPDGGQIPPETSDYIIDIISKLDIFEDIKRISKEEAFEKGLLEMIGEEIDREYLKNVKEQSVNEQAIADLGDDFKVVYTPFHGTGNKPVRRILDMIGVKNVHIVKEQEMPDPDFSTVKSPNPEDNEGFYLAIELAKKVNADVIFATDPDSDRVGVTIKTSSGEYITLTGNQVGVLLTEFILRNKQEKGILPKNGAVIKTIVTTAMLYPICEAYGIKVFDVLTGFKFIGEKMTEFASTKEYEYLFGFEESYGYLAGNYARDKDAVVASMLIAQMAADYKQKGMTLYEGLENLYKKYGNHLENLYTVTLKGLDGAEKIKKIMADIRKNPPKEVGGVKVKKMQDISIGKEFDIENGTEKDIDLPSSNVLKFFLEDNSYFAARPSGTEPKIKFYFGVCEETMEKSKSKMEQFKKDVIALVEG